MGREEAVELQCKLKGGESNPSPAAARPCCCSTLLLMLLDPAACQELGH